MIELIVARDPDNWKVPDGFSSSFSSSHNRGYPEHGCQMYANRKNFKHKIKVLLKSFPEVYYVEHKKRRTIVIICTDNFGTFKGKRRKGRRKNEVNFRKTV